MGNKVGKDEAFDMWAIMSQARNAILQVRRKELDKINLNFPQAAAITAIRSIGGNATPAEIARFVVRTPHSISVLLDRMEKQGIITKTQDVHRKNVIRVNLSPKGQDISRRQIEESENIEKVMSILSKRERLNFKLYLHKIRDRALQEIGYDIKHEYRHR